MGILWSYHSYRSAPRLLQLRHSVAKQFLASCRAAFLSHVLPKSHPKRVPSVLQLILLLLHALPLLATLPLFVFTLLPSIFLLYCLLPSQLTLYCQHFRLLKVLKSSLSKIRSVKPNCYPAVKVKVLSSHFHLIAFLHHLPFIFLGCSFVCFEVQKLFEGSPRV